MLDDVHPLTSGQIVATLGGPTALSQHAELPQRSAIANWSAEGIPAKYWPALVRIAASQGVDSVTLEVLEHHVRGPGIRAARSAA